MSGSRFMARRNEMQSAEVDGITTKAQAAMSKFERRPRDPLISTGRDGPSDVLVAVLDS
jgi:hypothetical protein